MKRPQPGLQAVLFAPDSSWRAPALSDLPPDWNAVRKVSIDCETCDPLLRRLGPGVRRGAYIAGISFCLDGHQPHYLPLRHLGGDNVDDPAQALAYVRYQAARFTGAVVGARLDYDLDHLEQAGVVFPLATMKDIQVAEPLIDELQYRYSLDSILERRGLPLKDEALLREAAETYRIDPKLDMYKLPARYVGPYAQADAARPLLILEQQEKEMDELGLEKAWQLGCRALPVLVKMRRRGVAVDFDHLDRVERFSVAQETIAWAELQRQTGVAIAVGDGMKAEVVAGALRAVGLEPGKTPTGKPSIDKRWLESIKHPAGALIRRARKMSQLRTTFVASIREHAVNGRVHATFNQTRMPKEGSDEDVGASFGRLSCSDPNMQQQPARDPEIGPLWRKVFIPDEGGQWASLDFSQQEPGLMLHFAVSSGARRIGEAAHQSALEALDRKRRDPKLDYHTMFTSFVHGDWVLTLDKKSKELKVIRDPCKNIYLGICYGEGEVKLCRDLGYPTKMITLRNGKTIEVAGDEGRTLLAKVDAGVPWLRKTADAVEEVAKARGYVMTISGRRLHFEKDSAGNYDWTYRALNRVIQGSAAEQTMEAMIQLDEAGAFLQLQVHDELNETVASREVAEAHARMMEAAYPLLVPNRVDVEVGPSWGEAA